MNELTLQCSICESDSLQVSPPDKENDVKVYVDAGDSSVVYLTLDQVKELIETLQTYVEGQYDEKATDEYRKAEYHRMNRGRNA